MQIFVSVKNTTIKTVTISYYSISLVTTITNYPPISEALQLAFQPGDYFRQYLVHVQQLAVLGLKVHVPGFQVLVLSVLLLYALLQAKQEHVHLPGCSRCV